MHAHVVALVGARNGQGRDEQEQRVGAHVRQPDRRAWRAAKTRGQARTVARYTGQRLPASTALLLVCGAPANKIHKCRGTAGYELGRAMR